MTNFQMAVNNTLSKLRAFQLLHYMIYPPHKYSLSNLLEPRLKLDKVLRFLRVPPKHFVANIAKLINIAKEHNIKIYFIAPPMGTHIQEVRKDYLLPTKFIPPAHKYYIDLLKDAIAGNPGAELIDFENTVFDKSLIMGDGIHPNARGHALIAEKLVRSIMKTKGLE